MFKFESGLLSSKILGFLMSVLVIVICCCWLFDNWVGVLFSWFLILINFVIVIVLLFICFL